MRTITEETPAAQVEITLAGWSPRQRDQTDPKPPPPPSRLPRITRLMALAIKLQCMVDCGEVRDYADIARLGFVTRARLTQIMNLLLLAPDIQEYLLTLESRPGQSGGITERQVRELTCAVHWQDQRRRWSGWLAMTVRPSDLVPRESPRPRSAIPRH